MSECNVSFTFQKAFRGSWPESDSPEHNRYGVFVVLEMSLTDTSKCGCDCQSVDALQIVRGITKDPKGKIVVDLSDDLLSMEDKVLLEQQMRMGLRSPNAETIKEGKLSPDPEEDVSIGWSIDAELREKQEEEGAVSPYLTFQLLKGFQFKGKWKSAMAVDAPSILDDVAKDKGFEFWTCAVCTQYSPENPKAENPVFIVSSARMLGCIKWGYYVGKNLKVSYEPANPVVSNKIPEEVRGAARRWEEMRNTPRWETAYRSTRLPEEQIGYVFKRDKRRDPFSIPKNVPPNP